MEQINVILSGIIMPVLLMGTGIYFAVRLRLFYILHPIKLCRALGEAGDGGGISPFRALTAALAGTLGVGNMAGVATAISAGGPGAVFWMWISALCAMSIKYVEVYLSVDTRIDTGEGYVGGAMYYIERIIRGKKAYMLSSFFAIMCAVNSLLTGNIVQVNSAVSAMEGIDPVLVGAVIGIAGMLLARGGGRLVSGATVILIPILSLAYIIICLAIIFNNHERLGEVFERIFREAFSLRSVGGGIGGYAVSRAMRFGITRGIFSNEAGCGTSPTAHAQAETKSAHHQGCFGIFEVFADTVVLCTMTAVVILLCDGEGLDGIPLTLYAFESLCGKWASLAVAVSVVLFAFATVISQSVYGLVSLKYLGGKKYIRRIYLLCVAASSMVGAVISQGIMWQIADLVVSMMTVINVCCLLCGAMRGEFSQTVFRNNK